MGIKNSVIAQHNISIRLYLASYSLSSMSGFIFLNRTEDSQHMINGVYPRLHIKYIEII